MENQTSNTDTDIQQRDMPSVTKNNRLAKPLALGVVVISLGALALNMENSGSSDITPDASEDLNYGTGITGLPDQNTESVNKDTIPSGYKRNQKGNITNNFFITDNSSVKNGSSDKIRGIPNKKSTSIKPSAEQSHDETQVASLQRKIKALKDQQKWERRAKAKTTMFEAGGGNSPRTKTQGTGDSELDQLLAQESQLRQQLTSMEGGQIPGFMAGAQAGPSNVNGNTQFGNQVKSQIVESAIAMPMGDLEYKIAQGKMIPCTLENAVDSSIPGMVRCVVSRNVYGETGRNILIPRGATVVGQYNSAIKQGQYRIYTMWTRIITSTYDINIGSPGSDGLGRAGNAGEVDTHFWKKFGNATLLSLIGAGAANYGVKGEDRYNSSSAYRQSIAGQFSQQANDSLQDGSKIPDTIHKDQGEKITIMAAKDLDFSLLMHQQAARL